MKQRRNECLLYAVCAVTGTDYVSASNLFRETHGSTWDSCLRQHNAIHWCDFLRALGLPAALYATIWVDALHAVSDPLQGTGVITISNGRYAHAMAFADGLVEDSSYNVIDTLDAIMERYYKDWWVARVHRTTDTINGGKHG